MHRTAFTALAVAAVSTGALGVPAASAATLEQLISQSNRFFLEDDSVERLIDRNNNTTVDEGDSVGGVVALRAFVEQPSGTTRLLDGVQNSALHGLFQLQVTAKTQAAGGFTYQFGPDSEFGTSLGVPGAMFALWEDTAPTSQLFPLSLIHI